MDPRGAQTPPARDPATAVGGKQRRARRGGVPKERVVPDFRNWEKRLKRSMRQRHFAGEKLFVDYAGRRYRSMAMALRSLSRRIHLLARWARADARMRKRPA